jgi:hypothetical protein
MGDTQALNRHKSRKYQCIPKDIVPIDETGHMFRSAVPKVYSCNVCGREYKYRSHKSLHQKTCNGHMFVNPAPAPAPAAPPPVVPDADQPEPETVPMLMPAPVPDTVPDMTRLIEFVRNNAPYDIQETVEALQRLILDMTGSSTSTSTSNDEPDDGNVMATATTTAATAATAATANANGETLVGNINNTGDYNTLVNNGNAITNNVFVYNFGSEVIDVPAVILDKSLTNLNAHSVVDVVKYVFFNKDHPCNMTVRLGSRGMNTKTLQAMDHFWKDIESNIVLRAMIRIAAHRVYKRYMDTLCVFGKYSDEVDRWHQHMLSPDHLLFFETRRLIEAALVEFYAEMI